jgi:hypothetical protein
MDLEHIIVTENKMFTQVHTHTHATLMWEEHRKTRVNKKLQMAISRKN